MKCPCQHPKSQHPNGVCDYANYSCGCTGFGRSVVEHAIANEYKTSILKDLYRREVIEQLTDITEVSWFDLTVGWAIAKGLSVADASKFAAAEWRAWPRHAAPSATRRLL